MTIIKQTGVSSSRHLANLERYINDDAKVVARGHQLMDACGDLRGWSEWMALTRAGFGHDKPARRGVSNKILIHQILAFLPDECDVNGGTMTPERCMEYAQSWLGEHYPHHEVVMALHKEHCKADGTYRYAVHMVINRSDLKTGKRLHEPGTARQVAARHASWVRAMDKQWGLRQVERDKANSKVHKRQPSKVERLIQDRDEISYKAELRILCQRAAKIATSVVEFREKLESWGIDTQFRNGKVYVTDPDHNRYSFSVTRLDSDLAPAGLDEKFDFNKRRNKITEELKQARKEQAQKQTEVEELAKRRDDYMRQVRALYSEYRQKAQALEGTDLADFPKLRLPKPPAEIGKDAEVQRRVLAYYRGADELRSRLASKPGRRPTRTRKPVTSTPSAVTTDRKDQSGVRPAPSNKEQRPVEESRPTKATTPGARPAPINREQRHETPTVSRHAPEPAKERTARPSFASKFDQIMGGPSTGGQRGHRQRDDGAR